MGYLEKKIGYYSESSNGSKAENDSVICFSNSQDESPIEIAIGICNGKGEKDGPNIASEFIKTELIKYFKHNEYKQYAESLKIPNTSYAYIFKLIIEELNKKLYHKKESDPEKRKFHASFTGAISKETDLYYAHIGDTRLYQLRGGKVKLLTEDHIIGTKVSKLPPPDYYAELYRAIGLNSYIKIDYNIISVEPNDIYIFCSSGLHKFLDEKNILITMMNLEYNPQKGSEALVKLARQKGSKEDISVACIYYLNYMGLEINKYHATQIKL